MSNDSLGTLLGAQTAANTLVLIDMCQVSVNRNCFLGAFLLAQ